MFNKKIIRIVAIVMAALMLLGVFGAAITAFATDGIVNNASIPVTGQRSTVIPIVLGIIALISVIICVVKSKKTDKGSSESTDDDYIKEEQVEKDLTLFTSKKEDTSRTVFIGFCNQLSVLYNFSLV